ncbi:MAG: [FeFe] hydrogenase H-cluster radical SAM maturase HydE [Pirellulales bacterium]|nr:[FeFe] hydrogenase H-cluster radical SAM maturase HydE [Pirellulales bacterium]
MKLDQLVAWLRETQAERLTQLWHIADRTRRRHVGDDVHLRGLVELSNRCVRQCAYCGLRAQNARLQRYRMSAEAVVQSAWDAVAHGYGTVVLQAGEDPGLDAGWVAQTVRRIKSETPLAVTLSLGEREEHELAGWREAGADRYLLRFETSNRRLYQRIHPPRPGGDADRFPLLQTLRRLGYEVGSGVMIGIPGQTYEDLARDVQRFAELDLDMIGVGPYLCHPETPLADPRFRPETDSRDQVPGDELTTYKVIALSRLVCPRANIPGTTALATLNPATGRELGLRRGANVVMVNLTPPRYRALYEIYPDKVCVHEHPAACGACMEDRIRLLGRGLGSGRGDSPNYTARRGEPAGRI